MDAKRTLQHSRSKPSINMVRWVAIVLAGLVAACGAAAAFPELDTPYEQLVSMRSTYAGANRLANWTAAPYATAVDSAACAGTTWVLDARGTLWQGTVALASFPSATRVTCGWVAGPLFLQAAPSGVRVASPSWGHVHSLAVSGSTVLVGTDTGLWASANGAAPTRVPLRMGTIDNTTQRVRAVAVHAGKMAVALDQALWRQVPGGGWAYFVTPGVMDLQLTALAFAPDGVLWIGTQRCPSRMAPDWTLARLCSVQGFPRPNITRVAVDAAGRPWFGTTGGVVYGAPDGFRLLSGPRWLASTTASPDDGQQHVLALSVLPGGQGVFAATPLGTAVVEVQQWTLADKAAVLQLALARHSSTSAQPLPGGARLCGTNYLSAFGDLSTASGTPGDNDGLWTGMYIVGQAYRYALTRDPAVKAAAWPYVDGLILLHRVTGFKGLIARTMVYSPGQTPRGGSPHQWQPVDTNITGLPAGAGAPRHVLPPHPPHAGYWWKSDASSDEVTGHMAALTVAYYLLCDTAAERAYVGGGAAPLAPPRAPISPFFAQPRWTSWYASSTAASG